jgi:hypothetical protein
VPIEELQVGDAVLSQDEHSGKQRYDTVINTFVRHGAPVVEVVVTSADGKSEILEATTAHPFWVQGQGWVEVGNLRSGDKLVAQDGEEVTLDTIRSTARRASVYNIEVSGAHTYFVGHLRT